MGSDVFYVYMYIYMYREIKYVDKIDSKLFVFGLMFNVIYFKGDYFFLFMVGVCVYIIVVIFCKC